MKLVSETFDKHQTNNESLVLPALKWSDNRPVCLLSIFQNLSKLSSTADVITK